MFFLPSWNPSGPHRASLSGPSGFFTHLMPHRAVAHLGGRFLKFFCFGDTFVRPSGRHDHLDAQLLYVNTKKVTICIII